MTNEEVNTAVRTAITNLNAAFTEAETNGMTIKIDISRGETNQLTLRESMDLSVTEVSATTNYPA